MRSCSQVVWIVVAGLLAIPVPAEAHTTLKGMGDWVNGLAHPVATPLHLLILAGLGLLISQQTPKALMKPYLHFLAALALALLATLTGWISTFYLPALAGLALAFGALVAWGKPVPPRVYRFLVVAAALAVGVDSAPETGALDRNVKQAIGTWLMAGFLVIDIAFYVSLVGGRPWQKIGVRVLGSWLAAIALLVLAFTLRR